MLTPVQPNSQSTIIPADAFAGQKTNRSQEVPQPVVDRKSKITSAREEIPREEVEKASEKLNRLMGIIDKRMAFSIHDKSHQVVVKIIDNSTGEVLDEIPPKRLLDILSSFTKLAGLIVDKKV